jgi:hypothetical protein
MSKYPKKASPKSNTPLGQTALSLGREARKSKPVFCLRRNMQVEFPTLKQLAFSLHKPLQCPHGKAKMLKNCCKLPSTR